MPQQRQLKLLRLGQQRLEIKIKITIASNEVIIIGIYLEEWRGQAIECLVGGGEDGDGSGQGEDVDEVGQLQQRHEDGELGADL